MHFTACAQYNVITTSVFVYIKLAFNTFLLAMKSSSSVLALN